MTKNEFVKRYGEEAYKKQLEQQKQYREQHREKKKQYNKQYSKQYREQHREELNQYSKQYYQQHREERKQYSKQYQKQYNREHTSMFAYCISEQIKQIENYEIANKDNFDGWHIHHRLETHNSDGEKRLINLSRAELIALDMYYNRPANELIFLTKSEHMSLHRAKGGISK